MSTRWQAEINSQAPSTDLSQYAMVLCYGGQDSPFLPQRWPEQSPVLIAPIRMEGRPVEVGMSGVNTYRDGRPAKVTNPSTSRAQRSLTFLMWQTHLTLRLASYHRICWNEKKQFRRASTISSNCIADSPKVSHDAGGQAGSVFIMCADLRQTNVAALYEGRNDVPRHATMTRPCIWVNF